MGGHTYLHYLLPPHTSWFLLCPGVKGAVPNYTYKYAYVPCKHGGVKVAPYFMGMPNEISHGVCRTPGAKRVYHT